MKITATAAFAFCFTLQIACFSQSVSTNQPAATNSTARPGGFGANNNAATQADHQKMLDLLGIKSIRRGREGNNTNSPYYANYDEARANPFPDLPDPLTLKNGAKVTTAEVWWSKRRPEIVEDFDREIYGRGPKETPKVDWEVTSSTRETNGTIPVITRQLVGRVDNSSHTNISVNIQLTLSTPANAPAPVPVIMQFSWNFPRGTGPRNQNTNNGPTWQQQVLAKGWGCATITPTSIQADNGAGLTQGIIGLCNKGQSRKVDDWGALRAWAWGASRALDYFETDKTVDAKHVGIEGHSRYGKATLVAMAYDSRFAAAYVSSSGEGGAKLHRRDWGEIVENVAGSGEYHWMAGNFIKYAGPLNWNDLPVDSHELIALCAPRPVFLSAGTLEKGDGWVDAKGTFLAGVGAAPVYALLGKQPFTAREFPPTETLCDGDLAFRQHAGGHTDGPNWPTFLNFAARYFATPSNHESKTPLPTIRIKAGAYDPFTDSSGNVWLADQGFADGETISRPELHIANTKDAGIYCAERFSMTRFTQQLPNGSYAVKLHFAETYQGITGPGQRVFSFNVEGREFKDFDVWSKAGGDLRAYVETVPVEITDGKLDIAFTANIENPQINGIEILPAL